MIFVGMQDEQYETINKKESIFESTWTVVGTEKRWSRSSKYAATSLFQPSPERIPLRKPLWPVIPWKLPTL